MNLFMLIIEQIILESMTIWAFPIFIISLINKNYTAVSYSLTELASNKTHLFYFYICES